MTGSLTRGDAHLNLARDSAQMLIGGEWRDSADTLPIVNPSTGAEIGRIARGRAGDIDAAVAAAQAALEGDWGRMTALERGHAAPVPLERRLCRRDRRVDIPRTATGDAADLRSGRGVHDGQRVGAVAPLAADQHLRAVARKVQMRVTARQAPGHPRVLLPVAAAGMVRQPTRIWYTRERVCQTPSRFSRPRRSRHSASQAPGR